jgi:ribosomal protein S6
MSENVTTHNDEVRLYELGINLVTTLEEKITTDFDGVKNIIKKHGAEIKSESTPVAIPLAYTMFKNIDSKNIRHNAASFGWVKFESTPDKIDLIKEDLDLNNEILRYVILKTTEEANTTAEAISEILTKKNDSEERRGKKDEVAEDEEVVVAEETVEEEIDEAIDAIVEEGSEA